MATSSARKSNNKKAPAGEGPPRWTYTLGAVVGLATIVWGVTSHFIPKAEEKKTVASAPAPASQAAASTPAATIAAPLPPPAPVTASTTVTGDGNVTAGGSMIGNTISYGNSPPGASSAASKPAQKK